MREKKRESAGGEEETAADREEEKTEKEAAIKLISTSVRGRCGRREYCGRKGTAQGGATLVLPPLPRRPGPTPRLVSTPW